MILTKSEEARDICSSQDRVTEYFGVGGGGEGKKQQFQQCLTCSAIICK